MSALTLRLPDRKWDRKWGQTRLSTFGLLTMDLQGPNMALIIVSDPIFFLLHFGDFAGYRVRHDIHSRFKPDTSEWLHFQ